MGCAGPGAGRGLVLDGVTLMSAWARPGVKCECIHQMVYQNVAQQVFAPTLPIKGAVYTIRETEISSISGRLGVRLEEIRCNLGPDGVEVSFSPAYFRPLITPTQEQDVEMFRQHLAGAPIGVDA